MVALWLFAIPAIQQGSPDRIVGDLFASSVAGIGDVDGDGHADFAAVVCQWSWSGTSRHADEPGVMAISGATGRPLWSGAPGLHVEPGGYANRALCPIGDVDADGRPDLAMLGMRWVSRATEPWHTALQVDILSGEDGCTIRCLTLGDGLIDADRAQLTSLGDVNGDGTADLAIVATTERSHGANPRSAAWLQSCANGEILRWLDRDPDWWIDGAGICGLGDIDGDGLGDVAVLSTARHEESPRNVEGYSARAVLVRSTRDDRLLLRIEVPWSWGYTCIRAFADVDNDGHPDFILAGEDYVHDWDGRWETQVRSGMDGGVLRSIPGVLDDAECGDVTSPGDVDQDGLPDILVSEYDVGDRARVALYSGRSGSLLTGCAQPPHEEHPHVGWGEGISDRFGFALAAAGDLDADSVPDWIVGQCTPLGDRVSRMVTFSGRSGRVLFVHDRLGLVPALGSR